MSAVTARRVTLVVPGPPVPKGRPRMTKTGHVYTPRRTAAYEEMVGWAWRTLVPPPAPFVGAVVVELDVYERGRAADADNYLKAVLDALNTLAWQDDKQVVDARVRVWRKSTDPRAEITITEADR